MDMETMQYWETYLNHHRAGATAGTALVRRIWRSNRRTKRGRIIDDVADSIEQELVVLEKVRAVAGISGEMSRGRLLCSPNGPAD